MKRETMDRAHRTGSSGALGMRVAGMWATVLVSLLFGCAGPQPAHDLRTQPYRLDTDLVSRSISFENISGAPGMGGQAAGPTGVGRKGAPYREFQPGESFTIADIKGPGTIRHIWMTLRARRTPGLLRDIVIRAYWDGQEQPSIECPLSDFMGFAHGDSPAYQSAVHSVGERAGMNIWLPMPFRERAVFTLTNEGAVARNVFWQIDYTLGDAHPADIGRLHVWFNRENPTTLQRDFELMPRRTGKGRYLGAVIGIRALPENLARRHPKRYWWGEGEVKIYLDGDTKFPTICGTGAEDYVGLSFGIQQTPFLYNGCSLTETPFVSMYRWHLPDPIYWHEECRVTMQQIAWTGGEERLRETSDDWSCAGFWYEPIPSAPLPPMPDLAARTADLWPGPPPPSTDLPIPD